MKITKLTLVLFLLPLFATAQYHFPNAPTFTPEQLKSDVYFYKEYLENMQPGLYRYSTKEEVDAAFDQIANDITEPMTMMQFCTHVMPLLKVIGNVHTDIYPDADYYNNMNTYLFFPLDVYFYQNELYVLKDLTDEESVPHGSIIKTINGESAADLFHEFSALSTRDGQNTTYPNAWMSNTFYQWYFRIRGEVKNFELDVVSPEGLAHQVTVKAHKEPRRKVVQAERYPYSVTLRPGEDNSLLQLKIEDEYAVLTLKTLDAKFTKERGQNYKAFLKNAFQQIEAAGVEHLILDLRNNGGGKPGPAVDLLSYLNQEPFILYSRVEAVTKSIPKENHYFEKEGKWSPLARLAFKKKGDIYEIKGLAARMSGLKGTKPTKPVKRPYQGELYVLTNPYCGSTTGELTGKLKCLDRVTFIGEESGGSPHTNVSGVTMILLLPNSHLRITLPLILFEVDINFDNEERGVVPDHIIEHPPADIFRNYDTAMEFTKDLILKKSNNSTVSQEP
ncbi:MAG: S41 family peptidase [Bacteroidota bacterium]